MPILSQSSRYSLPHRLAVAVTYFLLTLLGITMVIPFLITLTLSVSNTYDYQRFSIIPRYLYSDEDRFVKYLTCYFNDYTGWQSQMAAYIPSTPESWSNWSLIGRDQKGSDQLAISYLRATPQEWNLTQTRARDYADFCDQYSVTNSVASIDSVRGDDYLADKFANRWAEQNPDKAKTASSAERQAGALHLLVDSWNIPFTGFDQISFLLEMQAPMWQQSWFPPQDAKFQSFAELKEVIQHLEFMPGIHEKWSSFLRQKGIREPLLLAPATPPAAHQLWLRFIADVAPASPVLPYASRADWRKYLQGDAVRQKLQLNRTQFFDIGYYNQLAGTNYSTWFDLPFPIPANTPPALQQLWNSYVEGYPLRLTTIIVTPALVTQYDAFLENRFKTIDAAQRLLGVSTANWNDFALTSTAPTSSALQNVWADFVQTLPHSEKQFHSSESDFQQFMLARYGSLDAINQAWGTRYSEIEEVFPPFAQAYAVTFQQNKGALILSSLVGNYQTVFSYLFRHANAVPVTLLLITLSILCSLTINPMAAYALSRFSLRGQDKIILFLLATSAFPAMISAIPGFLLMRDLGMLNTFFALILPGAANGMAIFILKGFFDSLPPELYEAATIDGAKEWQIFLNVTMPMVKPILAVNALGAFIAAYAGWEWALIVCQDQKMWTLAVWMYQASQWWAATPWLTCAGFVIISIPTLVVFLTCQRIILQGIIIPQMK